MTILTEHGRGTLPILLPADASPLEKFAADELRHYLGMMSACVFTVTEYTDQAPGIYIGRAALQAGFAPMQDLGREGFSLTAENGSAAVMGASRGVIYGVYALLERLGCRFFTATCEKIPFSVDLSLPDFSLRRSRFGIPRPQLL